MTLDAYLQANPDLKALRVMVADLNGQARGKRIARHYAAKALETGIRCPYSTLNLDIWGKDIEDSPLVFQSGDADGVLKPTGRDPMPAPWVKTPTALLPMWMFHDDGTPFAGDPRQALAHVMARYAAAGLTPVVATELEFYLIDDSGPDWHVPPSPQSGKQQAETDILGLRPLDAFDGFLTTLYDGCAAMDIPANTAISEGGPGQFEFTLMHQNNAMKAADDAWLFKMLTRGIARNHGFAASFMAKPYPNHAGSGLHCHFSVLDAQGRNIFNDGTPHGTDALRFAIAGCLAAMPGSMLVFAPHGVSFDRFVPGAHAPTAVGWGMDNRTVAVRVPAGAPTARRIEHRVAGADVNPYLYLAVLLGAALNGIQDRVAPPAPITGNAYRHDLPHLPTRWGDAIASFENCAEIRRILTPDMRANFLATKRQEMRHMADLSVTDQRDLYLDTV